MVLIRIRSRSINLNRSVIGRNDVTIRNIMMCLIRRARLILNLIVRASLISRINRTINIRNVRIISIRTYEQSPYAYEQTMWSFQYDSSYSQAYSYSRWRSYTCVHH